MTLALLVAGLAPARAAGETEVIQRLDDTLLDVMQNADSLGFSGRYERLEPVLNELFDFPAMAQLGLARYWADLVPEDRGRVVEAFARMSIATFAARFDGFNGQSFEIVGTSPGPRSLVLVKTMLHRPADEAVELTYVMRDTPTGPRVIDVLSAGKFSELARQRAEMSAVYGREGLEGLIASLQAKARELAGGS